jgi:GT2 family glycosyltransferase
VAAVIRLPRADDPEVSVIVLLDGAVEMAERGLRALAAADDSVASEVVIVLNDPDPELERLARSGTSGATIVLSRANAGPGVGWNLGAAAARAPRLATLHEDSEPQPGWLTPLCETMTETGAGAVGARLFNHDGSIQNCGWVLFADASHWTIDPATAPEVAAATEPTPADMLSGAAMLVDRAAVDAVGGWDERFHPAVFVDIDVSTAIWAQGRPVYSVPASRVIHRSGTFDSRPRSALSGRWLRLFLLERNRGPFIEKWGDRVTDLAPPPADLADPDARAPAVAAALALTRGRAARVRAGGAGEAAPAPQAEARFTGIASPVAESEDLYTLPDALTAALDRAEAELIDEYCRFLIRAEEDEAHRLAGLFEQARGEMPEQHQHIENLRGAHDQAAAQLEAVVNSRTWRLHNRLARLRPSSRK